MESVAKEAYEIYMLALPYLCVHSEETPYTNVEHCMHLYKPQAELTSIQQLQRANKVRLVLFELLRDGSTPGLVEGIPPADHALSNVFVPSIKVVDYTADPA